MILHMLDTDTASYIIKKRSVDIEKKLIAIPPASICISAITRAELKYGLKKLPANHLLHVAVQQFLTLIRILSWDSSAADYYADIRHQLVTTGQPIGEMDMMIAAHALSANAVLVTNNTRHYQRIELPLKFR